MNKSTLDLSIFKAYDVRGLIDSQLTPEVAYLTGRAYAQIIAPQKKIICLGRDVRSSGPLFFSALAQGLLEEGYEVIDLGVISTDMLYFAVGKYEYGGGITVSASHNPREYNGFKMIKEQAQAISSDTGLLAIRDRVQELYDKGVRYEAGNFTLHEKGELIADYADFVSSFADIAKLKPLKIAFNNNHGYAATVMKFAIERFNLPITASWLWDEPNGDFPQGKPDPLQEVNQQAFKVFILKNKVDLGVAWDADADRVFFFDEHGEFIDGYFTTALLAEMILLLHPNEKIIHDPRQTWATIDAVTRNGGIPLVNKVGHSFIKSRMKEEDAIFAGENSGHYYFRENWYADNGMIPFFLMWLLLSQKNMKPSELLAPIREKYFISGEINLKVEDPQKIIDSLPALFVDAKIEHIDGVSIEYPDWRCNVRSSNTEPLLRLNLEAKSKILMEDKLDEVLKILQK